jgi:hypothetical protein
MNTKIAVQGLQIRSDLKAGRIMCFDDRKGRWFAYAGNYKYDDLPSICKSCSGTKDDPAICKKLCY